ncbi:hypothetical protein PO909_001499 [Leuciscus waleckii]
MPLSRHGFLTAKCAPSIKIEPSYAVQPVTTVYQPPCSSTGGACAAPSSLIQVPHLAQCGDLNPETIRPLAMRAEAWEAIQGMSEWVLNTIEHGYSLQFARRPPRFLARTETRVNSEAAHLLHAENSKAAAQRGYRTGPSFSERVGLLQPLLPRTQEGWSAKTYFRSETFEESLMRRPFKMITTRQILAQIRPGDWFISLDLKDAYFQIQITPRHRPFLRFAFDGRDPGSAVLNILELLKAPSRNPDEECITVVQPGGDKSMDELLCSRKGKGGAQFGNIAEVKECSFADGGDMTIEGKVGVKFYP